MYKSSHFHYSQYYFKLCDKNIMNNMQKFLALSLTLCFLLAAALAVPIDNLFNEEENPMQVDEKAGGVHHKPLHEIVHVHHVPAQIPVYASMVVYESQPQQAHIPTHHQQHQISHSSPSIFPYQPIKREEAQSCSAPNNAGFKKLFREAAGLLPKKEIAEIIKRASKYDPQVREFRKVFFSQETLGKLLNLRASTQFNELANYSCERLFLNMRKFFKFLSCMIAAEEPEEVLESIDEDIISADFQGRSGLRGLIKDIYEILPHKELKELYKELKDNDRYLRYGVRQLKSAEFQELLMNLRKVPEYRELKKVFQAAGLPIEEYNKLFAAALGWEGDIPEEVFQI